MGHANYEDEDWAQVISQVNTLQTLFNRAMLKVLGYSGNYIDRSAKGWPDATI